MKSKKGIIGYYDDQEYEVCLVENGQVTETIYTAGNSPCDSQAYVLPEDGIGLEKMRRYCEITSQEIAEEHGIQYLGVEKLE